MLYGNLAKMIGVYRNTKEYLRTTMNKDIGFAYVETHIYGILVNN